MLSSVGCSRHISTWVAIACAATGCATRYRVVVDGPSLHQQSAGLRQAGRATVEATEIRGDYEGSRIVPEVIEIDQTVTDGRKVRWVRDLLRGCVDEQFALALNPDCELVTREGAVYELRSFETRSIRRFTGIVIGGGLTVGLLGALGCSAACEDGTSHETASNIIAIASGAALVGLIAWMLIDCAGRWGSPGCRD